MNDETPDLGLSADELASQGATVLPDKEVVSILDLNADINLAIDAAAPIDLATASSSTRTSLVPRTRHRTRPPTSRSSTA
ncbi:MAG: hypothetical protein ABIQ59_13030 [Nocardioidaceae bacterium]